MFRIEPVEMTPQFAGELLRRNAENQRTVRKAKVDQYARDMAAGDWPMTGDTIKVDTDGRMIDGQHRLLAVRQAEVTVPMLIAYDVSPEVMAVLDTGTARTFSDVLRISGAPSRTVTAAIVRRVLQWEAGNRIGTSGGGNQAAAAMPTNTELRLRHEKDPAGFDSASSRASDVQRAKLGSAGPVGTAYYLFAQLSTEDTHRFFDAYILGANLSEGDPILSLRNRMVRVGRDERLKAHEALALFIRAWNAWREDRKLAVVPITTGGRRLNNANFPIPK